MDAAPALGKATIPRHADTPEIYEERAFCIAMCGVTWHFYKQTNKLSWNILWNCKQKGRYEMRVGIGDSAKQGLSNWYALKWRDLWKRNLPEDHHHLLQRLDISGNSFGSLNWNDKFKLVFYSERMCRQFFDILSTLKVLWRKSSI